MRIANPSVELASRPLGTLIEKGQARNVHDLNKALRSGDLEGAKAAYANIVKDAPEGATWNPDSAFAQLGKALATGNLGAAKAVMVDALRDARSLTTQPVAPEQPMKSDSGTTGAVGAIGSTINLVA
jgi:hypothetical protein